MSSEPWYRTDPDALEVAYADARRVQPLMRLDDEGEMVVLRGRFDIEHQGSVVESFALDVELSTVSPRDLPVVRETGGRIPRVLDPHHCASDGALCVLLPESYWFYFPAGLSLAEYLQGPLRDHLAGQALVLQGKPWPAGEWSHGLDGVWEFYEQILKVPDRHVVLRLLKAACDERIKGHHPCPCGYGSLMRRCHGPTLRTIRASPTFTPFYEALKPQGRRRTPAS